MNLEYEITEQFINDGRRALVKEIIFQEKCKDFTNISELFGRRINSEIIRVERETPKLQIDFFIYVHTTNAKA